MNRRGFLRGALAAAVGSCVRWLPMPAAPRVVDDARDADVYGTSPATEYTESLLQLQLMHEAMAATRLGDWVGLEPRYSDPAG